MLSLVRCLWKMFVLLQMELGRWIRWYLFSSCERNVQKVLWGIFAHWLITRRMFADSVHVEWWTCDRDGCYTLWSWQDDGLCVEPSRLRYELPVLLHWQVKSQCKMYYLEPREDKLSFLCCSLYGFTGWVWRETSLLLRSLSRLFTPGGCSPVSLDR